jgi:hypothetical protein
MPWKAVKKNRAKPTTKVDMKACCQARGFGDLMPKVHMVNAGEHWIPIRANM